jgi:hypothetical protein
MFVLVMTTESGKPGRKPSKRAVVGAVVGVHVIGTLIARRRGYNMGGNVIVRCRQGHLFTTIWVPGASIKSLRLGWARFQHCPVGKHWTLVTPVKPADLTEEQRRTAGQHRDVRLP